MKRTTNIFMLLIMTFALHPGDNEARADWTLQVSGTQRSLNGVYFLNQNLGWVVGDLGTILRTTDGGITWTQQSAGTGESLLGVQFVDENVGWAVGIAGLTLCTTNGGAIWTSQPTGTTAVLTSIQFINHNTGWIGGWNGTILHTTDGGQNWELTGDTDLHILDFYFVDENSGWAVTEGPILHTDDGGATWVVQPRRREGKPLTAIHFFDRNRGLAVGTNVIQTTTNGGETWSTGEAWTLIHPNGHFFETYFPDAHTGWAVGLYAYITYFVEPVGSQYDLMGHLFAIHAVNANDVWAVGTGGSILHSSTGGTGFEPPSPPQNVAPSNGSAVGTNATLRWGSLDSSEWFNIQVSTTPQFLSYVLNVSYVADTSYNLSSLLADTEYYWRVSVHEPTGTSNWSETWSFTTSLISADPLAQYGICYGSTGNVEPNNPGALISIDPLTGTGTLIGPTGIIGDAGPAVRALAIRSTGEMYAMSHTASSDLYSVNASTGAGTLVANTGLLHPGDICFDAEDVLFAVDDTNILYIIDETTGVRTVVGATGVALGGLAYDPTDGTMYGSGSADDIYTIDLETGTATLVGITGLGGNTPDIHFDQAGNLFGVKRGAGGVYDYIAIDKTTGAGTLIGSTGFVAVVGLATRLVPPSAIPCVDVANFQTRCQGGGTIQARLTLANTNYTGEIVEFSIDGSPYQVTVGANGRANLSVGVFDLGLHTVEVTIPAGCVDPVTVRCRSGLEKQGDELWNDEEVLEMPTATTLLGNYPNPFNPSTTIRYGLSEPQQVTLRIYNTLGQLVKTVVDEHQVEGYHEAIWDGRNETGAKVASGIYVYRMAAGSFVETKKLLLVK